MKRIRHADIIFILFLDIYSSLEMCDNPHLLAWRIILYILLNCIIQSHSNLIRLKQKKYKHVTRFGHVIHRVQKKKNKKSNYIFKPVGIEKHTLVFFFRGK
jgi:hypothetical protein